MIYLSLFLEFYLYFIYMYRYMNEILEINLSVLFIDILYVENGSFFNK